MGGGPACHLDALHIPASPIPKRCHAQGVAKPLKSTKIGEIYPKIDLLRLNADKQIKKGRSCNKPRPFGLARWQRALNPAASVMERALIARFGKLRVGLQAALAEIDALVFFLFADAHTHHGLDAQPDNQAGKKHPTENSGDAG